MQQVDWPRIGARRISKPTHSSSPRPSSARDQESSNAGLAASFSYRQRKVLLIFSTASDKAKASLIAADEGCIIEDAPGRRVRAVLRKQLFRMGTHSNAITGSVHGEPWSRPQRRPAAPRCARLPERAGSAATRAIGAGRAALLPPHQPSLGGAARKRSRLSCSMPNR